ncbi:MAG: iron-sulfur cluster repair di-iron protein, partial [Armatimonadota bacterium]
MPNPTTPPPIRSDDPAWLKPFTAADTVGDIVTRLPEAAAVFREARIDYCCGGKKTLGEALQKRGLDVQPFLDELNRLLSEATSPEDGRRADWRTEPLSCLVDHIVRRHHAYLEHELPELAAAVTKLLRVHGDAHPELAELHRTFHELKADLEQHLFTEEKRLFPLVRRAEASGDLALYAEAARLIDELERDHENAGRKLAEMRDITRDYQLPA